MDFPVEATVRLDVFPNQAAVRDVLRSHGFALTDVGAGQVHVKGSFWNLKAAKASLEPLLGSQTASASGAVSKRPGGSGAVSAGGRGRDKHPWASSPNTSPPPWAPSPNRHPSSPNTSPPPWEPSPNRHPSSPNTSPPPWAPSPNRHPSSPNASPPPWEPSPNRHSSSPNTSPPPWALSPNRHPSSPERGAPFPPPPGQRGGRESFVVDVDVLRYAEQLRKKDIDRILVSHDVIMEASEVGESGSIALLGKSARAAAGKLQSLMDELSRSLRTQEVPLQDMGREGQALWKKIQNERNVHQSVVVWPMNDTLHLIGPSAASYELKQRLLGGPVGGRTGRTSEKNSKRRSSSLPPISRKNAGRDAGAVGGPPPAGALARPPPAGAAAYSPSKYQDDERGAAAGFGEGRASRGRSHSEARGNTRAESVKVQETQVKRPSPMSPKKALMQFVNLKKDIKKKLSSSKRK